MARSWRQTWVEVAPAAASLAKFVLPALVGLVGSGSAGLLGASEPWLALIMVPSLLWLTALPLARAFAVARGQPNDALRLCFDAFWIGVAYAPVIFVGSKANYGASGPLVAGVFVTLVGFVVATVIVVWGRRRNLTARLEDPTSPNLVLGIGVLCVVVAGWFYSERVDVARPLARYWYSPRVEELPETCPALPTPTGILDTRAVDDEGQAFRVRWRDEPAEPATIYRHPDQPLLAVVLGGIGSGGFVGETKFVIAESPIEAEDEGPVRRYRFAGGGATAVWIPGDSAITAVNLRASNAADLPNNEDYLGFFACSQAGVWAIDSAGEIHFTHYYQLLNMVEQFDWAETRWVTDVQPPLWTWVLGSAVGVTRGDMPTANVLLTYILVGLGLGGLLFVRRFAHDAPWPVWLLPGAGAVVVGKLVLEPGSASMPDALYTAAIVGAVATVQDGWRATSALGLAAQLLRYPGSAVVFVAMMLAGLPRVAIRFALIVVVAAGVFGAGGYATGALDGWLETVAWESGPEHWHGEYAPTTLVARIPDFYGTWLYYAGGAPLLALIAFPQGTRITLGTAFIYSLLLCTIDHSPTHYFLPLVMLSVLAVAASAAHTKWRPLAWAAPLLTLAGLGIFWFWGEIVG